MIRAGYELLGLITYFTAGPKESRAWTIPEVSKAVDAAGIIHTDFARGFICAETIGYDDYIAMTANRVPKKLDGCVRKGVTTSSRTVTWCFPLQRLRDGLARGGALGSSRRQPKPGDGRFRQNIKCSKLRGRRRNSRRFRVSKTAPEPRKQGHKGIPWERRFTYHVGRSSA